jgi:hypothetical protein
MRVVMGDGDHVCGDGHMMLLGMGTLPLLAAAG